MPTVQLDSVPWIGQKPGLCGPACVQMVLASFGTVSTGLKVQDQLWTNIQANTAGSGPPGGKAGASLCGHFPTQICEDCRRAGPLCWCSHPAAVATTLMAYKVGASVVVESSEKAITEQIVQAIAGAAGAGRAAPIVLVGKNARHWVVAYGFVHVKSDPLGIDLGGFHVTELLIRDPALAVSENHCLINYWFSHYLRDISCGAFEGQHVIVR